MVNTKQAMESQFITAALIKESPTKTLVVINPGDYEQTDFGKRLTLVVNIDGKEKTWRPNKESVENLQVYGEDSTDWLSKKILLKVEKRNGKEYVIASASKDALPKQEAIQKEIVESS